MKLSKFVSDRYIKRYMYKSFEPAKKLLPTKMPNQYNNRMMIKNWENNEHDSKT